MENKHELVIKLNEQIGTSWSEIQTSSEIYVSPRDAFYLIKCYSKTILNSTSERIISKCIENIEELVYGEIFDNTRTKLRKAPKIVASHLIDYSTKFLDLCRSESDLECKELLNRFGRKFLYFEGFESGSVIIWIQNIFLKEGRFVWSGLEMTLRGGISINQVEEKGFEDLPYYSIDKSLSSWLEDGSFAHMNSRELSPSQVKGYMENQLYWEFENWRNECGVECENLFKEKEESFS